MSHAGTYQNVNVKLESGTEHWTGQCPTLLFSKLCLWLILGINCSGEIPMDSGYGLLDHDVSKLTVIVSLILHDVRILKLLMDNL